MIRHDPNTKVFSVAGTHSYAEEGSDQISVSITDVGGASTSVSSTATVADAALTNATGMPVNATEGNAFTATVATFKDADPNGTASDYTATITWGDGTTSTGTITQDPNTKVFSVAGTHTYTEEGSDQISVSITDVGGASTTASSTATVVDAALTNATGVNVSATEGASFTTTVATFKDADPNGTASDYTATITWGDGTTSTGTITQDPNTKVFSVAGTHTYAEEGTDQISVSITDVGGASTSVSSTANIGAAALSANGVPISATEGTATGAVTVATFTEANPNATIGNFTATINWGDGTSSTGTITEDPNTKEFSVTGAPHTYAEEGNYTINVGITDVNGASTTAISTATVVDAALTNATGMPVSATEGTSFTTTVATFKDADPNGTASDYTATITWGDGTTSTGTITQDPNTKVFSVAGTHTYAEEGTDQISV